VLYDNVRLTAIVVSDGTTEPAGTAEPAPGVPVKSGDPKPTRQDRQPAGGRSPEK
jgi:hypothetical protein